MALDLIKEKPVDVIVTDQRMPNLSGVEFFRKIRAIHKNLPIIMVSGYLDSDTVRGLINNGVNGIFLKPLNIFSLLKRTAELLDNPATCEEGSDDWIVNETEGPEFNNTLGFTFNSFPCKASDTAKFAEKLYSLRNFKTNLMIIGKKGAPFERICDDLRSFEDEVKEELTFLKSNNFNESEIMDSFRAKDAKNVERISAIFLETESLNERDKELIYKIAKKEKPFDEVAAQIRFVFCMHEELDTLYDEGLIDENFYIFLGTSEVHIPALEDCKEDISLLAESIIFGEAKKNDRRIILNIDSQGLDFLEDREWPGDYSELKQVITTAMNYSQSSVISFDDLCLASELKGEQPKIKSQDLENYLRDARDEYAQAVVRLCQGDVNRAAKTLGVAPEKIESFIKTYKFKSPS